MFPEIFGDIIGQLHLHITYSALVLITYFGWSLLSDKSHPMLLPTLSPAAMAIIFDRTSAMLVRIPGLDFAFSSRCAMSASTTVYEYCALNKYHSFGGFSSLKPSKTYLNRKYDYPESVNCKLIRNPKLMQVEMPAKPNSNTPIKQPCSGYLKTGLNTARICPNEALPTSSLKQVSANIGGST